ncbi:MAG: hypothetical protein FWD68_02425 [Alphaproteobacteria bacterium]|nr:hypothetical protein [Alphaproteobacteria bacterium]
MPKWAYITMHALVAGVFFFLLERLYFDASVEQSLLWALPMAGVAAGLAHMQANR